MEIRERLHNWGEWQRGLDGVGISTAVIGAYTEEMARETGSGEANPQAQAMDQLIARMKKENSKFYYVISSIYIWQRSITIIASEMNGHPSVATIKIIRVNAENYLAGCVAMLECPNPDMYKKVLTG